MALLGKIGFFTLQALQIIIYKYLDALRISGEIPYSILHSRHSCFCIETTRHGRMTRMCRASLQNNLSKSQYEYCNRLGRRSHCNVN